MSSGRADPATAPRAGPSGVGGQGTPGTQTVQLRWQWLRFGALGVDNLYDALALRCRVFVLEQGPYLDPDGCDRHAWHLLGRDPAGQLHALLRVLDPGVKYAEPSIGRVVTAPEVRRTGLGHALVAEGVNRCATAWPRRGMRISAQTHLALFYGRHGFQVVGQPYLEDNIPHLEMWRAP